LVDLKTFGWRSSALLCFVTLADYRRPLRVFDGFFRALLMSLLRKGWSKVFPCGSQFRFAGTSGATLPIIVSRDAKDARVFSCPSRTGSEVKDRRKN
jgi:hypothetical protein